MNVVIILGPIVGVVVIYHDHPQDMVVTPQLRSLISMFNSYASWLPQFVSAAPDLSARSVTLVFNFTNPINFNLTLYSVSADIVASQDNFSLGYASLVNPTCLLANKTSDFSILCQLTQDAEDHLQTAYAGAPTIDVDLVGLTIDVNGIVIQLTQPYHIPDVPIAAQFASPQFVSATSNVNSQSVTLTFSFTNPFGYDLSVNSVSATIVDSLDNFTLANANLINPITIPARGTSDLSVLCQWTATAVNYFHAVHPNATTVDVDVVGLVVNVNNITIQVPNSYHIPNVPINGGP